MSYMRDDEFYVWGGIDGITISKAARRTPEQQAAVDRKYMRFEKFMIKVPTYADDGVTVRYWTPDWPRWTRLLGIRRCIERARTMSSGGCDCYWTAEIKSELANTTKRLLAEVFKIRGVNPTPRAHDSRNYLMGSIEF